MRAGLFLFILFAANSFADLPSYVGVWKYSGNNFNSVQFLNLYPSTEGFTRTASVSVSAVGTYEYSPYNTLLTKNPTPFIPKSTDYYNPVYEEWGSDFDIFDPEFCNFLLLNQEFPLAEMLGRRAIPEQMRPELLESSLKLLPDQVTFLESIRTMEDIDIIASMGKIPTHARLKISPPKTVMSLPDWMEFYGTFYDTQVYTDEEFEARQLKIKTLRDEEEKEAARVFYDVKSASAWLISGQTLTRNKAILPLEKFGKGVRLQKPIDRRKFKLIWELGRAAQIHDGDLNQVLQAAFLQIQSEIALLAGVRKADLDNAYVFAHSLDDQHTRLYELAFGMKFYSDYEEPGHGVVLSAKVSDFMNKIKMNQNLNGVAMSVPTLQSNLSRYHEVTQKYGRGLVAYRDFSLEQGLRPPVSDLEEDAYETGARNPNLLNQMAPMPNRYDQLYSRMRDFYEPYEGQSHWRDYDRDNYIRHRWRDLQALVIDDHSARSEKDAEWYLTLFSLAMRNEHHPKNIGMLSQHPFAPEVQALFEQLGMQSENILFTPVTSQSHRIGFQTRTTVNPGSRLDMHWFDFERVKGYLQKHPVEASAIKIDDHWDEPLPGT